MDNVRRPILLVDDDPRLAEMLTEFLGRHDLTVDVASTGDDGCALALSHRHDLVLLDVMLPGIDGFEVLRRVRAGSEIPVIMLTACGEDVDRIVGLELGADDYLPKPFNPRELLARIRAIQRRLEPGRGTALQGPPIRAGDLELDAAARRVSVAGAAVRLTAAEFDLLLVLMETPGVPVERETVFQRVLGRGADPFDRSIDMHVSRLRKKLGAGADGRPRIEAVRSVGYVLRSTSR